jgi:hypothetical protein
VPAPLSRSRPVDLVDRACLVRQEEEVAVRPGEDLDEDPEVPADEQALALDDVPRVGVVGDEVLEPRVADLDARPISGEVEVEEVAALEEVAGEGIRFAFRTGLLGSPRFARRRATESPCRPPHA